MIEGMIKNQHKGIWRTPDELYKELVNPQSKLYLGFIPQVDSTVSDFATFEITNEFITLGLEPKLSNSKCPIFVTEKQDFFKTTITKDAYGNFPYLKSETGVKGMDKFFERAYKLHIEEQINFAILAFTVITSSGYYQKYVGPKQINEYGEKVDLIHIPKRVIFLCRHGFKVGTPAFSSFVIVFRKENIPRGIVTT